MVTENVEIVRKRIQEVCFRCGRKPEDVLLLCVSKTFGVDRIRDAIDAGLLDFGENYAQEFLEKRSGITDGRVRWHFIGHLQSNKVKYIVEHVHLIHSVDNERLAEEIQKRGEKTGRTLDVLVEVHTTDEATKYGVPPEKTVDLVKSISGLNRVRVQGLMTMGPLSENPEDARPSFRLLRELKDDLLCSGINAPQLSMGMSEDPPSISCISHRFQWLFTT